MKIPVLALVLVASTFMGSGQAATYGDTDDAYQDCQLFLNPGHELTLEESIRANSCVNFVIGAWDMGEYLSWKSVFLGTEPPFCPPEEGIDVAKAIQAFVTYVEEHPEEIEHRLAMVLEMSFENAFPCTDDYFTKLAY